MTITMTNTGTIAKVGIPTLLIISTLLSSVIGNHIAYSNMFIVNLHLTKKIQLVW